VLAKTMGIVAVAALAAKAEGQAVAISIVTCSRTSSAASTGNRSSRPSAKRYSMATLRPAAKPDSSNAFRNGADPVQLGLVASFNRPGGNATGVFVLTSELGPKRFELVRELLPKPGTIAFIGNANSTGTPFQIREMQAVAQAVGQS
jgi:hypothetical protein